MTEPIKYIFVGAVVLSSTLLFSFAVKAAETPNELRALIDSRAQDLSKLNKQIKETQGKLNSVTGQKKSLNREIKTIDYNIRQLNLNIRSSEVQIEKSRLEMESIGYEIADIKKSVDSKHTTIKKLVRILWEKEQEGLLTVLLKNKSLADSVLESESIRDFNQELSLEVQNLKSLNGELKYKYQSVENKKSGIETERRNLKNRQSIVEDKRNDRKTILKRTKNQEKIYQSELKALEDKQTAIGLEITKLEDALRAAFDPSLLPSKRPGVLGYPVKDVLVTQNYGRTKFAERAYRTKEHNGIDFRASVGTPIFAAADGEVFAVGNNGRLQYGRYIMIKHNNNLASLYAHLSRQIVGKGDIVKRGDLIGYSGSTGYITGPHLHFGVYWAPSVQLKRFNGAGLVPIGVTINPKDYL